VNGRADNLTLRHKSHSEKTKIEEVRVIILLTEIVINIARFHVDGVSLSRNERGEQWGGLAVWSVRWASQNGHSDRVAAAF